MGKILFWFVVITAVLFAARLLARSAGGTRNRADTAAPRVPRSAATADMSQAEAMVRCEHCGIHMPRSEAFRSNGRIWCGPEHARLGQDKS